MRHTSPHDVWNNSEGRIYDYSHTTRSVFGLRLRACLWRCWCIDEDPARFPTHKTRLRSANMTSMQNRYIPLYIQLDTKLNREPDDGVVFHCPTSRESTCVSPLRCLFSSNVHSNWVTSQMVVPNSTLRGPSRLCEASWKPRCRSVSVWLMSISLTCRHHSWSPTFIPWIPKFMSLQPNLLGTPSIFLRNRWR